MTDNELTEKIIQCAMKVHSALGPGLLESAYRECLYYELRELGFSVMKEKSVPLIYKGQSLQFGYRADLIVENRIIVELKSIESLNNIHLAQVLTYLRLSDKRYGLLINFNVLRLKDGIKRVVNGY